MFYTLTDQRQFTYIHSAPYINVSSPETCRANNQVAPNAHRSIGRQIANTLKITRLNAQHLWKAPRKSSRIELLSMHKKPVPFIILRYTLRIEDESHTALVTRPKSSFERTTNTSKLRQTTPLHTQLHDTNASHPSYAAIDVMFVCEPPLKAHTITLTDCMSKIIRGERELIPLAIERHHELRRRMHNT